MLEDSAYLNAAALSARIDNFIHAKNTILLTCDESLTREQKAYEIIKLAMLARLNIENAINEAFPALPKVKKEISLTLVADAIKYTLETLGYANVDKSCVKWEDKKFLGCDGEDLDGYFPAITFENKTIPLHLTLVQRAIMQGYDYVSEAFSEVVPAHDSYGECYNSVYYTFFMSCVRGRLITSQRMPVRTLVS